MPRFDLASEEVAYQQALMKSHKKLLPKEEIIIISVNCECLSLSLSDKQYIDYYSVMVQTPLLIYVRMIMSSLITVS